MLISVRVATGASGAASGIRQQAEVPASAPSESSGKMKFLRSVFVVISWFLIFPAFPFII